MIRTFIAIMLEAPVINKIAEVSDQLRPNIAGVRWVAPANIHLTLKFLGGIEESAIEPIHAALYEQLRLFQRFTINAKGLGVFPGPRRPRVLWVGLIGDPLISLASKVEFALQPFGFVPETRAFTPHLTIGRWRQTDRATKSLVRHLENWNGFDFGKSEVENVKLMQSVLKPQGASYNPLVTIPLGGEMTQ